MQTETQQNLQKEMQKMQQKFKAREDKAKKDHREEMGRVCIRHNTRVACASDEQRLVASPLTPSILCSSPRIFEQKRDCLQSGYV